MKKTVLEKENVASSSVFSCLEDKPMELKVAYIGGGSRGWAHSLMLDLLKCPYFNGEVRLYDINHAMAELNAKYGNWLQGHPEASSKWNYRAVKNIKDALAGADFVFLSIQPGSIEYMKVDLEEPVKYGIYQSVGDTVGPGGCIRALRTIRDYFFFAEAIGEYAPEAWCLNFTNPMTICTRSLYKRFPDVKAFGCCHEVFKTQRDLAYIYRLKTGDKEPARNEVEINVLGINHFTWVDKAEYRGNDLMAIFKEYFKKPGIIRRYSKREIIRKENVFIDNNQVKYELFRRFGVLAAAGDRHLAEFVPWFLTSKESCYRWGFMLTPYSYRIGRYKKIPRLRIKEMKESKYLKLYESGEEFINQMLGIVGRMSFKTNVNLPNKGQMGKVPLGAVVETNAVFSKNKVEPVISGSLPDNVNILVLRHVLNQESLVEAVNLSNEELAFQSFLNDPLVGKISADDAWKLFKIMLRKTNFKFKRD